MVYKKICDNCKKEYNAYYKDSRFCSRQCRHKKVGLKNVIATCPTCKRTFKWKYNNQIHCNRMCFSKSDKLRNEGKNSQLITSGKIYKGNLGNLKENVGYTALHDWVRNHKPKTGHCHICKSTTNGTSKYDFDLANISGKYLRDLNDYTWLCRKCHSLFDTTKAMYSYQVIGVECKVGGEVSKIEKQKFKWYLDNHVFSSMLIAHKYKEKGRIKIKYDVFEIKYKKWIEKNG